MVIDLSATVIRHKIKSSYSFTWLSCFTILIDYYQGHIRASHTKNTLAMKHISLMANLQENSSLLAVSCFQQYYWLITFHS